VEIRIARPDEYAEAGALTASVFLADGLVGPDSPYLDELNDGERRAKEADLLVAVDGAGRLVGSVTFVLPGSGYAELASPGEAEFRMLVVDPSARGHGVGAMLVRECVRRAQAAGAHTIRLSTGDAMTLAYRIYAGLGFRRTPERDWEPTPEFRLRTHALDLTATYCDQCGRPLADGGHLPCARAATLDPPRWCARCRRRMVVQVTPTGWTARCVEHGTRRD